MHVFVSASLLLLFPHLVQSLVSLSVQHGGPWIGFPNVILFFFQLKKFQSLYFPQLCRNMSRETLKASSLAHSLAPPKRQSWDSHIFIKGIIYWKDCVFLMRRPPGSSNDIVPWSVTFLCWRSGLNCMCLSDNTLRYRHQLIIGRYIS